jgi:hypothetical protein
MVQRRAASPARNRQARLRRKAFYRDLAETSPTLRMDNYGAITGNQNTYLARRVMSYVPPTADGHLG